MKKIRKIRLMSGLTQYDVEQLTGISQTKISLIERGYRKPSSTEMERLEKVLKHEIQAFSPKE